MDVLKCRLVKTDKRIVCKVLNLAPVCNMVMHSRVDFLRISWFSDLFGGTCLSSMQLFK